MERFLGVVFLLKLVQVALCTNISFPTRGFDDVFYVFQSTGNSTQFQVKPMYSTLQVSENTSFAFFVGRSGAHGARIGRTLK